VVESTEQARLDQVDHPMTPTPLAWRAHDGEVADDPAARPRRRAKHPDPRGKLKGSAEAVEVQRSAGDARTSGCRPTWPAKAALASSKAQAVLESLAEVRTSSPGPFVSLEYVPFPSTSRAWSANLESSRSSPRAGR
jgi:hypothetical protein